MTKTKLEIEKVLVVSTAHMTKEDCNLLTKCGEENTLVVYDTEFFFLMPMDQELGDKFSPAFRKLFDFVKNHEEQFTHLKLDGDGMLLDDFEEFDWPI